MLMVPVVVLMVMVMPMTTRFFIAVFDFSFVRNGSRKPYVVGNRISVVVHMVSDWFCCWCQWWGGRWCHDMLVSVLMLMVVMVGIDWCGLLLRLGFRSMVRIVDMVIIVAAMVVDFR